MWFFRDEKTVLFLRQKGGGGLLLQRKHSVVHSTVIRRVGIWCVIHSWNSSIAAKNGKNSIERSPNFLSRSEKTWRSTIIRFLSIMTMMSSVRLLWRLCQGRSLVKSYKTQRSGLIWTTLVLSNLLQLRAPAHFHIKINPWSQIFWAFISLRNASKQSLISLNAFRKGAAISKFISQPGSSAKKTSRSFPRPVYTNGEELHHFSGIVLVGPGYSGIDTSDISSTSWLQIRKYIQETESNNLFGVKYETSFTLRDLLQNSLILMGRSLWDRILPIPSITHWESNLELTPTSIVSESIAHKNIVIVQETFTY